MSPIRQPTAIDTTRLFALGAIWGSAFLCIEIALTGFAPLTLAAGRIALAAVALAIAVRLAGLRLPTDRHTLGLLTVIGFFNTALPFVLISWGQVHIDSAMAAILMAAGPFVALILSHFFTGDDRLTLPKIAGMLMGFAGVAVLVGLDAIAGAKASVLGQLAVMGAAACYALSGVLTRRVAHVPPLANAATVLVTSTAYMVPLALLVDRPWQAVPGGEAVLALVFLGLLPTGLAYLLRFQIITAVGATFMSQVSYLVPLFAVLWGWLFLAEIPSAAGWVALVLILGGIGISRLRIRRTANAAGSQGAAD